MADATDRRGFKTLLPERVERPLFTRIPAGPFDAHPALRRMLQIAAFFEQRGAAVLGQKAAEAESPIVAEVLRRHACEERGHVERLCELAGNEGPVSPPLFLRLIERVISRSRPLPEQTVATLVVESLAIAAYSSIAEALGRGRAAEVILSIADEVRIHLDQIGDLLGPMLGELPPSRLRRLRRLRAFVVGAVLLGHAIGHSRILGPIVGPDRAPLRARILREVERSFAALPALRPMAGF
jgi:rubrerythrin